MANIIPYTPYGLNPLMRDVLITNAEVIFHAPTKETLDVRTIQNAIIIAEERYIRPGLGYDFYTEIAASKNRIVTGDNIDALQIAVGQSLTLRVGDVVNSPLFIDTPYRNLWYMHLWKLCAECVLMVALPDAWIEFTSEGPVHGAPTTTPFNSGGGHITPDLKSMQFLLDKKQMDRIDPLLVAMQQYLCANKTFFPKYYQCPQVAAVTDNGIPAVDATVIGKRSDWLTGIYDDDNHTSCYDREERNRGLL